MSEQVNERIEQTLVEDESPQANHQPSNFDADVFPPTKLQEPVYWLREGVTWTKEKTEGFTLLLKRWVYSKWVRALKPSPVFPKEILVGSLGELSHVLARETEVPEEFVFAASLTVLGAICAGRLKVNAAVAAEPRLYTVLLGKSYTDKKSTALRKVFEFFAPKMGNVEILRGVGSAEGLAREFREHANILLAFDEFRAFFEKAKVQTSVLLPMVTSLFEANEWDNPTKMSTVSVRNARLSLVGCCTEEIYERLWSTEAIGIGFLNRLFVVGADRKERVSWPEQPNERELARIRERVSAQIENLPKTFDIAPDARALWDVWYHDLPDSVHARRLDTLGFRLMAILAQTMDKAAIDLEVVEAIVRLLKYELALRTATDPVDADGNIAKLEEKIRRQLRSRGPLSGRDLRRFTHAKKDGLWVFQQAVKNLTVAEDIDWDKTERKFKLISSD